MAWNVSAVFISSQNRDAIGAMVVEELNQTLAATVSDDSEQDLPQPMVLTPVVDGWMVLTGVSAWIADLPAFAKTLAHNGADDVLLCQLVGNQFRLQWQDWHRGELRRQLRTPDLEPDTLTLHRGKMPLYEDVEHIAFNALIKHGVARELAVVGTMPLGCTTTRSIGRGTRFLPDPQASQVREEEVALALPCYRGDYAPVLPRVASNERGWTISDERYVEGKPHDQAVDRLIELEEKLSSRLPAQASQANVLLNYFAGPYQAKLDQMLLSRGHAISPRPPRPKTRWFKFGRTSRR